MLVEAGFIPVLLTNLNDYTQIVEMHLETLKWLLYCDGKKIALDEQGFETLVCQPIAWSNSKTIAYVTLYFLGKIVRKNRRYYSGQSLSCYSETLHDQGRTKISQRIKPSTPL